MKTIQHLIEADLNAALTSGELVTLRKPSTYTQQMTAHMQVQQHVVA